MNAAQATDKPETLSPEDRRLQLATEACDEYEAQRNADYDRAYLVNSATHKVIRPATPAEVAAAGSDDIEVDGVSCYIDSGIVTP
jgi:hypothetical protein